MELYKSLTGTFVTHIPYRARARRSTTRWPARCR